MNTEIPASDRGADDARLERLLCADAERDAYIEDAGFTGRVMAALPAPRPARSYSWLGPALGALAAAGVACFSPAAAHLAAPFEAAFSGRAMSVHGLLVFLPVAALVYTAAWFAATDSA